MRENYELKIILQWIVTVPHINSDSKKETKIPPTLSVVIDLMPN